MAKTPCLIFRSLIILLLAQIFGGELILAGNKGKIVGTITDSKSGDPLLGANVLILDTQSGSSTDLRGDYVIINVHPGVYSVVISYIGYETVTKTEVLVTADRTTTLDAALNPTIIEGVNVTVVAERPVIEKDLTASEQVVSSESINRSWIRTIPEAIETKTGVFLGYYRGSSNLQAIYLLNNVSVNSGLLSDNYSGFNLSAIQEISLLTGGYNAEYGQGRSAVINIVEKESSRGVHGTLVSRLRPAGIYHYGRHIYSQKNFDYTNFDLDYWTAQSHDPLSRFFGQDPEALLAQWQQQITPSSTLRDYDKRKEYEIEGTLYGAITSKLGFLTSARYKKGVGRYPQAIPYNPDYNFQGYLDYKLSPNFKIRLGGFFGGWESAEYLSVNFNTLESAQESQWLTPMQITQPYSDAKYAPAGSIYRQWPELRRWKQLNLKLTHLLNKNSFYEFSVSFLNDKMDRSDRDGLIADSLFSRRDDQFKMVDRFLDQGFFHAWDHYDSKVYQLRANYTNQITKNQEIKFGLGLDRYDFSYEHFMGVHEGGQRWNLLNVFDGTPFEGHVFAQDKLEYKGIVINAGVRLDFFDQNRQVPANMFDPLAFQPTTPGHDPGDPLGVPGDPEMVGTKLQVVLGPRLGIAHPISENSVLHFSYGHFFQRPSWTKMFGFPFVNYTENMETVLDPYANQTTYMEEWQGWYGNPRLGYERTIQYELGIDYNIADRYKLDVTGYYKDSSREADVITGVYASQYIATKALTISNSGYSDVRGIETTLESRLHGPLNFGVSHDIFWSFVGEVGYSRLYEPGSQFIDVPKGLRQEKGAWSSFHKVKSWANFYTPRNWGPELAGFKPFGDLNIYAFMWWRTGDPYTYHGPGDLSTKPNNQRWFNYYQVNLKVAKGFSFMGFRSEFSVDVRNVFNSRFLRLLFDDDLTRWHENPSLPDEERLPRNSYSNEPDVWNWYSYDVPPREIFFQYKVDF